MSDSDVDDFTELVDFIPDRVDLVGKAANGTEILVAKSAEGEPVGLFDPDFVRELVAKADAEDESAPTPAPVTVSGSPAAVAEMMARMHGAPVRKAEAPIAPELDQVVKSSGDYADVVKAKYSAEQKRALLGKGHAMRNADGEPDYPVDDEEDLGKAIHAVGRGGADHDKIRKYVMRRAREMGHADRIPENWASNGSLKAPVAKADGDGTDPGSPAWESADAATGEQVVAQILACIPAVRALVMREATEVGAGHTDDICDVLELQGAIDSLTCAAKCVAAFAASEHAEAGEAGPVSKAQSPAPTTAATAATSPKEKTVDQTTTEVAKAEGTAAQTGAEVPVPITKAQALAALGLSPEQLAEIGAQSVLKAMASDTKTTGADGAPEDARVIPGTDTVQSPVQAQDDVAKAQVSQLAAAFAEAVAPVVKQVGDLAAQVGAQTERVEKAMKRGDDRRSPLLNGATGEPGPAPRGPLGSPEFQKVIKAIEAMPEGDARDEAKRVTSLAALEALFSN